MKRCITLLTLALTLFSGAAVALEQGSVCMENICVGDDLESLQIQFKPIEFDYNLKRRLKNDLAKRTVDDIYEEYYEILITDQATKKQLLPYIIYLQKFDNKVIDLLGRVRAICTPLTLTGEVDREGETRLFVTFRAVPDNGRRGKLRVVALQKQFKIFPPHLRPEDKSRYVAMLEVLKKNYPGLKQVRDIDARPESNEIAFAPALLGFRFYSDVNSPLVLKLQDTEEIEPIDFSPQKSKLCPAD